jgi:hypothetical protein
MNGDQIRARLLEIDARQSQLEHEKDSLEVSSKWTPEAIGERIRTEVKRIYGDRVKLALLKVNSEYNDQGYNYTPNLILVDVNYDQVDHTIDADMFMPTDKEQCDFFEVYGYDMELEDIKIKL